MLMNVDLDRRILRKGVMATALSIKESDYFDLLCGFDKRFIEMVCEGDALNELNNKPYVVGIIYMMNGILEKICPVGYLI